MDAGPRRATRARTTGLARAGTVALLLGKAYRDRRRRLQITQGEAGARVGLSQQEVSRLERGEGRSALLETWAVAIAALDGELNAYLKAVSAADRPRDYEHLRRQRLVIETARAGGWTPSFEERVSPDRGSSVIDVVLRRAASREIAVVEVWDWFSDIGDAVRSHAAKMATIHRPRDWTVSGLLVVRGTRRNRELAREFGSLLATRYPGSSTAWLRTLTDADARMPTASGFLWTDIGGTRLQVARLS